jgi:hypothetical protein
MAELHRVSSDTDETDREMPSSQQKGLDSNPLHFTRGYGGFRVYRGRQNSEHTPGLDSRNPNFGGIFFFQVHKFCHVHPPP